MPSKADAIFERTGRWWKNADRHAGGWDGDVPRCCTCGQRIDDSGEIEYSGDGYHHRPCYERAVADEIARIRPRRAR